jgi:hypothetical protein
MSWWRSRGGHPLVAAALVAVVTFGCAAAPPRESQQIRPPAAGGADLQAADEAEAALRRADDELTALRTAPAPDCPRACALAANVCALSERICLIAGRYPADDPLARRCADGRARCARSRAAVVPTCGCDPQSAR